MDKMNEVILKILEKPLPEAKVRIFPLLLTLTYELVNCCQEAIPDLIFFALES